MTIATGTLPTRRFGVEYELHSQQCTTWITLFSRRCFSIHQRLEQSESKGGTRECSNQAWRSLIEVENANIRASFIRLPMR
jgi:hypothetical protein